METEQNQILSNRQHKNGSYQQKVEENQLNYIIQNQGGEGHEERG